MWARDKYIKYTYILKYFSYHLLLVPMLTPNHKQPKLSPANVRKVCLSLDELYVKSVYLHLFWWRGLEVHGTFFFGGGGRGAKAIKVGSL